MTQLLIEIGCEEIPAGYIEPALDAFARILLNQLDQARVGHGAARVYGTPRRLAVLVEDVADAQTSVTTEMVGPPASVGFDADGKATMAAEKFAEKAGVSLAEVTVKETPKGRYLCARKLEPALPSARIVGEAMPGIIAAIPFPKTMRWGTLSVTFARPIHWIVALMGGEVIPFTYGDIASGNTTYGHRFMAPAAISLSTPAEYVEKLRAARVIAYPAERREMVKAGVSRVASELGGRALDDPELVDIVKNLVEYPVAAAGRFDDEFLEVPDEVLITAMREHQKYFSVADESGRLMPCFIVINNTEAKDPRLVSTGHERVLRARLSDAQFFFRGDIGVSMETWVDKLRKVLFQARLGSIYDKMERVRTMAAWLAGAVAPGTSLTEKATRAALLCKADLVSHVVVEFTKLQGVMGRIYATRAGEDPEVAAAIEDHYRPTYSGGPLPVSETGALVAIADKIDSICGCFSVGLIPTGGADPYALRRQSIGILQIMNDRNFSFSLRVLIEKSVSLFADKADRPASETVAAVYDFMKNRISGILAEEGFSRDVIAAVADVSIDHVPHVRARVSALESLKAAPDFEPLAVAFKRVVNIIRKSVAADMAETVDAARFEHDSERGLWESFQRVHATVTERLGAGAFDAALKDIATLRAPVDAFFEGVMVMTDDMAVRRNRMALLGRVAALFDTVADFSKIST